MVKSKKTKKNHPELRPVVFRDSSEGGGLFLMNSTATSERKETININGKEVECDVINVNTSSKTHPFCSGNFGSWSDTDNKIKNFNSKFGMFT